MKRNLNQRVTIRAALHTNKRNINISKPVFYGPLDRGLFGSCGRIKNTKRKGLVSRSSSKAFWSSGPRPTTTPWNSPLRLAWKKIKDPSLLAPFLRHCCCSIIIKLKIASFTPHLGLALLGIIFHFWKIICKHQMCVRYFKPVMIIELGWSRLWVINPVSLALVTLTARITPNSSDWGDLWSDSPGSVVTNK